MDCNEVKNLLYDLVTGKVKGDTMTSVERHLQECQNCRQARERIVHTIMALNAVQPPPLSPGFQTEVLKRAQRIPLPSKPLWPRLREWFQVPYIK
ncbi:MAG: zf-HC2 domain-containing protein [Deltaproteobacteria bacterium]|nr:zf-HC2 domain-containing protein [Deltaproteobacteria bacterium]